MKYIALLRGINVGGNHKVSMAQLKNLFEQSGFSAVSTYINSGNILFTSEISDLLTLKSICERFLCTNFSFPIPVTIISVVELHEALAQAPDWWNECENSSHNAIFVIPPLKAKEVMIAVGECKPEYEKADYYGQVIFWSALRTTIGRTNFSKIAGTAVYKNVTIRNANTVLKLAELTK